MSKRNRKNKPGFFGRLRLALSPKALDDYTSAFLRGDDVPGGYNPDGSLTGQDSALSISAFWGCLRVLSETFMSVPVFEYRKDRDGDRKKTDDTGLFDMLHAVPNFEMNATQFYEMGMYQINLGGDFVAVKQFSKYGKFVGLAPQLWQDTQIKRDKKTRRLTYNFKSNGQEIVKNRWDVFHVPGPSVNGITGMSALSFGSASLSLAKRYETFGNRFFQNAVMASGIFSHPDSLDDEPYKRLKSDLQKSFGGLLNSGKPMLLEDGLQYTPFAIKLSDAELLSSKKFQVVDICRFLRVPPHMVQDLDRATNNNIEHQSLEFVIYTMLPWFKRWESAINTQLLTREQRRAGYYFEFNISGLIRGDLQARYQAYALGRQWGFLSVNDIRRLENMNSIGEAGDIYLQPMNMVPAGTTPDAQAKQYEKIFTEIRGILEGAK